MLKRKMLLLSLIISTAILLFADYTQADEISQLKEMVRQQQQMLEKLQQRISELEAKQENQQKQVRQISVRQETVETDAKLPGWLDRIKFGGDFRYRHQSDWSESSGTHSTDRHRNRIRFRFKMDAEVNDETSVHMRLATGDDDNPASTNSTLDGGFSSKNIWLDQAYLKYQPKEFPDAVLFAGKMPNPFYSVGGNELIWDGDVTPEGGAIKYNKVLNDSLELLFSGGGFWVEEEGSIDTDQSMWAVQGYAKYKLHDQRDTYVLAGASYYDFARTGNREVIYQSDTTSSSFKNAFGNTFYTSGTTAYYTYDYNLVEGFAELGTTVMDRPVTLYYDHVINAAASVPQDTAWLLGFNINKLTEPGDWSFGYDYREVQADAVIGLFNSSDFAGGRTNSRGHRFGISYLLKENMTAALNYYCTQRASSAFALPEDYVNTLQLDFKLKF